MASADSSNVEVQFTKTRAEIVGIPFVELFNYPIDRRAVSLVAPAICRSHEVLPIGVENGHLILAMADPGNVVAMDDVRAAAQMQVEVVDVERSDLLAAIDRFLRADDELNDLTTALVEKNEPADASDSGNMDSSDNEVPIVRFVNLLISQAIQDHASDIHIEPAEHDLHVRYRIDGVLHEMQTAPKSIQSGVISRIKIMSDIDIAERRKPQDGRMSVRHGGRKIDLRVATLPTVWGEKIVMRILDNPNSNLDVRDLALLDRNFEAYQNSYSKPYGMILITGPTGSGKSTTLYTTLGAVARPERSM